MADENQYLSDLQKLRSYHVEERRKRARDAVEAHENAGHDGLFGADIDTQQLIIDAIDDAIEDEEQLAVGGTGDEVYSKPSW